MSKQPVLVSDDPLSCFLHIDDNSKSALSQDEDDLLAEELLNAVVSEVEEAVSTNPAAAAEQEVVVVLAEPGVEEDGTTNASSSSSSAASIQEDSSSRIKSSSTNNNSSFFFNRGLEASLKMAAVSSSSVSSLFQKAASNLMNTSTAVSDFTYNTSSNTTTATTAANSMMEDSTSRNGTRATIATIPESTTQQHQHHQLQLLSDPTIQAKLVSSAVGPLLQGERIIMFLPHVVNVASTDTSVTGLSSSSAYTQASLWAVCMTFFRFLLIHYTMEGLEFLAMAPGSVIEEQEEITSETTDTNAVTASTTNGASSLSSLSNASKNDFIVKRATKVAQGLDNAIGRAGLSRQWQYYHASSYDKKKHHVLQIPLSSIDRVEKGELVYSSGTTTQQQTVVLYDKNGRWMRFTATNLGDAIRAHEALSTYAFPGKRNLGYLFAFESCREEVLAANNTTPKRNTNARYDPENEFSRMGLLSNDAPWSTTKINSNYSLCSSYPSVLVVPHVASEEKVGERGARLIRQTASFRSEGRLPALTWGCGHDAASLWRCSQPKVGLGSNRSPSDEFYLKSIVETAGRYVKANTMTLPPAYTRLLTGAAPDSSETDILSFLHVTTASSETAALPTLRIMDLRPKSSAMANRTQGYGYESTANYPNCHVSFYNIPNIHGVRDSYQKLNNLAQSPSNTQDVQFSTSVESSSGWLTMIRCILNASWQAAAVVNFHRLPVLLHCSHGWDRTSQVAAIAQLMLDPFYRTMDGFAVLVEKDFCAFGHPFHTRSGHGERSSYGDSGGSSQRAPIFLQFLDCVWQLTNIFPTFFEFNGRYLLAISDHIYSCRFGTLLCDNERERVAAGVYERTKSLWDYLDEHRILFTNPRFHRVNKLLLPPLSCILRRVSLWSDYHLRYSPRAFLACVPKELVPFIHYEQQLDHFPEELKSLFCASDESDALLNKSQLELEKCRSKCKQQEIEIFQLRQALEQMEEKQKR